uniref:Uncharacterized protein n=1 Tax=Amphimedon queenslandica TaxID=400682 RepID=A0A1X7U1D8_AMPQE
QIYSRSILWLKVALSNNDPRIITSYYVDCVRSQGCPRILRVDMGTENLTVSTVQPILRRFDSDHLAGGKSFIYGKSTIK